MSQEIIEEVPERDQLLDHDYDGIREYDNPTPGWWVGLFVLTIVFSALYIAYYFAPIESRSIFADYASVKAEDDMRALALLPGSLSNDEDSLVSYMRNPKFLAIGKSIFQGNCVSCHGANGQGVVGPNLTDNLYKNVSKITDIPRVIAEGANNGAMPAWKNRGALSLNPKQITLVAAYVASLRGQNLPGPGVAGDREIPPWPKPKAASAPASVPTSGAAAK
jgi:cytochrome c oxidase cbb3-type subunit 3